jgi:hypothetical protein
MRKIKEQIISLGLDPKRELIILLAINAGLIVLSIFSLLLLKNVLYLAACLGLAMVFSFYYVTRYSKKISVKNRENLQDFVVLFGYFRIYIHNGFSVYSALKEITNFANPDLKKSIEQLINEIDEDKSIQPFIKFGKQFNEIIVEEMMISIYQLIDDGETSDYLMQFELIFDKFQDLLYQKQLKAKDSKLGAVASSALIGSSFLMIVLTIGIIGIIGDFINGL